MGEPAATSRMARRQRMMLGGAVTAAVLSACGLFASTWVRSPAEVAADTEPPSPTLITAPVVLQKLTNSTIFRGTFAARRTVSFSAKTTLAPDGTVGATGTAATGRDPGNPTVTAVKAKAGQQVKGGKVLIEVGYRPIFTLPGKIPAIRNLTEGDRGPDVAALQRGLQILGHGHGADRLGTFGAGTASAVSKFYSSIGYPVPKATTSKTGGGDPTGKPGTPRTEGASPDMTVMMPASEVMYVPSLPATVTRLDARTGGAAGDPVITLSTKGLRLQGRLDPSMGKAIKAGQAVTVLDELSGRNLHGRVAEVGHLVTPKVDKDEGEGEKPTEGGQAPQESDAPYIPVEISPASGEWSTALIDQDVRITAYADVSDGEVLAVPTGAVTTTANGTTAVTVVGPDGRERQVPVTPGASADGLVGVEPASGAKLAEGDRVVVGR